jgi:hypothetical protein
MSRGYLLGIVSADNSCNAMHSARRLKPEVQVDVKYKNKKGLPVLYNEFIDTAIAEDREWLMLCHNDINFENVNVPERVTDSGFDVVGVAGTVTANLKPPALWHLMGGGFEGGNLRGAVAHGNIGPKHMTSFGEYPARCVMLDGVFLAIHRRVFTSVRFDESNPAKFHFYDLSYTLDSHNRGFKVGVGDIQITHESPGLREFTDEWKAGQKWFLEKYNEQKSD